MADELVQLNLSPIFHTFRHEVEDLRDNVLKDAAKIMRREEEASIRQRWYRSGTTLRSLQEKVITEGNTKVYQLFPTAVSSKGAPYPLFGEYGTGKAGALSGRPAPQGYKYGDRPGMEARRYSRSAVKVAQPQILQASIERVRRFAANMTN